MSDSDNNDIEIETEKPKRRARGKQKSMYHYVVRDIEFGTELPFKTTQDIKAMYGISRATVYLMINEKDDRNKRKYKNLEIIKKFQHYLTVEHGIDEKHLN